MKVALDTIYRGECLEMLRQLPEGCVDLVVSSPPYNLGKEYESKRALEHYLEEQRVVLGECARVLSRKGSIFWQVGAYSDEGTLIPLDIRVFPILEEPRPDPAAIGSCGRGSTGSTLGSKFSCRYETILWFTKSGRLLFQPRRDPRAAEVPEQEGMAR